MHKEMAEVGWTNDLQHKSGSHNKRTMGYIFMFVRPSFIDCVANSLQVVHNNIPVVDPVNNEFFVPGVKLLEHEADHHLSTLTL